MPAAYKVGNIVGIYKIIDFVRQRGDKRRNRIYLVECTECGTRFEKQTDILSLRQGCPECYRLSRIKPEAEHAFKMLYYQKKANAKRRGFEFDIDIISFRNLSQQPCFYCGQLPSGIQKPYNTGEENNPDSWYLYSGLDRIDNSIGYILTNVVPCCQRCNIAKYTQTQEEFYQWIDRVYKHIHDREGV